MNRKDLIFSNICNQKYAVITPLYSNDSPVFKADAIKLIGCCMSSMSLSLAS